MDKTHKQPNENYIINFFKKFISFNDFLTPNIIVFIFWIGIISICFSSLVSIISGHFIAGIIGIVLGSIFTKVCCEILIVLFKINENLKEIAKNTKK